MATGGLDVSKWQAARRQFSYDPVLWFYFRMIEEAVLTARMGEPMPGPLRPGEARPMRPTDEALLARDWVATSEPPPAGAYVATDEELERDHRAFISFPECCQTLNLNPDRERVALLEMIDARMDADTDEAWARLEALSAREPEDDPEPLFDAPRVVPVLDQISLF